MARNLSVCCALLICPFVASIASADDWPQWLGPRRDSVWRETGIVKAFPKDGLKVKWRVPVSGGYSGPAVADGRVYVMDYVRESGDPVNSPSIRAELTGKERVLCFDARAGETIWKHEYDCPYKLSYPAGPRATPTVQAGKVYALGAEGNLTCLDAKTGQVLWARALKADYKTETPIWGFCGHPLVDGNKLFCLVGGRGSVAVAFDKDTGEELWRSLSAREPGYCPPTMIEAAGRRQLLIWHAEALNSLDPANGKLLWTIPLEPGYGMSIAAPRKFGDFLFASGIGNVGALMRLDQQKPAAKVVWQCDTRKGVACANSTPFVTDDLIFGVDTGKGDLRAIDLMTGQRLWETFEPTSGGTRRAGSATAFIVRHEDRFFLFSETGDLILARLSREGYEPISRDHLLDPSNEAFGRRVVWSHPAFANRCVFARNDKELVCVSLAAE